MESTLGRYTYRIRSADANAHGVLALPRLMDLMQDAARQNASALHASVEELHPMGLTWVLSRLRLVVEQYPLVGQEFLLETWPSGFDRSLVYRDYRFSSLEGKIWGRASSTWLVLDLKRRRPSRVPETWLGRIQPPQDVVGMDRSTEKWDALKKGSRSVNLKVRWPHLDINEHVNQTHYVSWCLDTLSHAIHQEAQCRQIDLILRKEILLGEEISIQTKPQKADLFNHAILGERSGEVKAQMLSYWAPRSKG